MADKTQANIGFEKQLWDAACVLWGHIPAAEYRKVIIGLIFLRYISNSFEKRYAELLAEGDGFEDDRDAYEMDNIFFVPEEARYIIKSPVRRIHKVKTAKVVKDTYTDEELELMRDNCRSVRDLAMIDLFASSGMRVGELVALNREDINFSERECVVLGKGDKERMVYFDARTKLHLQDYLAERSDTNPALFVTLRAPH